MHDRGRLEQDHPTGIRLAQPDARLRLLAADGERADPARVRIEPADREQRRAPERHRAAHDVAHLGPDRGLPPVGAADDPPQLGGHDGRLGARPDRRGRAAHRHHARILERTREMCQPGRIRPRVVVEEGDDVAVRLPQCAIAGAGQPARSVVGEHPDAGPPVHRTGVQLVVVVGDQDDLVRRILAFEGSDRQFELIPPVHRVGADDDADRHRLSRSRLRARPSAAGPSPAHPPASGASGS